MQGKTLILGVTGGIAVYKVPELISRLYKKGLTIEVIMTKAAAEFVTPLTFREVSHNQVHLEMFQQDLPYQVEHISLAKKADLMAVIPASANLIGKVASGIADDLLSTTIMATRAPKLIAPAMNTGMYENPILQRNLQLLKELDYQIVEAEEGELLCGDRGLGRLANLEKLELEIARLLTPPTLAGEVVLVTAGGTREPLDPVRYIGNRSSGKMGHALAVAAWQRGAEVHLVTTASNYPQVAGMNVVQVETALEMSEKVLQLAEHASVVIKAAAPADFRPAGFVAEKIKKERAKMELPLTLNPDILAALGARKRPGQFLVGFAAETSALAENARTKLVKKNLDLIIGNLVNLPGLGMESDRNRVTIYSKEEAVELPENSKENLASQIWEFILDYRGKS